MTDQLQALWQASRAPASAAQVLQAVERQERLRARTRAISIGLQVLGIVAALWVDWTGALPVRGVLSIACVAGLLWYVIGCRRADRQERAMADLTPAVALDRAVALSAGNVRSGWMLAAFPLLVGLGVVMAWWIDGRPAALAVIANLNVGLVAAIALMLLLVTGFGVSTLAAARRTHAVLTARQQEFRERV
jgi:Flp pilus assembly protein TadB